MVWTREPDPNNAFVTHDVAIISLPHFPYLKPASPKQGDTDDQMAALHVAQGDVAPLDKDLE